MPIGNSGTIDETELDKIDSEVSYSPSLGTAVKLVLRHPAFVGEGGNVFV
jgi:hypothetical protein